MKNKKNDYGCFGETVRLAVAALALAPTLAAAAPWEYGVIVEAGVVHTDNLFLAADGAEESDTVLTLRPEFFLRTEGDGTDADIRYRPEAFFYSDFSEADDVYNTLDATITQALVSDRLFITLNGINYQSIVTPDAVLPTTNLPVTNNRIDSRVLTARPSWRQRLGAVQLYADVGYTDLEYDDERFQASQQTSASFSLDNIAEQQGVAFSVDYNFRRMEYEVSVPFEYHRASLNLGVWASSALRVFAVGGVESAFDDYFDPNMDDPFWEAGFQYVPNERLNVELAAGERGYGASLRSDISYRLRRGSLSLNYSETPTNRAELVFQTRPLANTDSLDNVLDQPGNISDRFIRRRLSFSVDIDLPRSDLSLRAFTETRDERTDAFGVPQQDEELTGFAGRWQWRFGSKTTLDIGFDLALRDDSGREDDILRYEAGMDYRVSPRTSLRLAFLRAEQEASSLTDFNYTENQLRLMLRLELP